MTVRDPDKFFHHFGTRMPITVDRIRDALLPTVRRIGPGILTDHFPGSDTPPDADAAGHLAELSRLFDDALRKQTVFEELGIDPGEITVAGIRADEEKTDARREGDAKEIFRCNIDGVLELTCSFGENETCGTGFFVGVDGYLLTNAHVVISRDEKGRMMAAGQIICSSVHSGLTASADVIYADGAHDLALLLVGTAPGKVLKLAKELPEIGDRVFAIGNNRGEGLTFLDGIVGDVDREFNGCPSFMFNALVSTGCSGGPVFNGSGEVCGMTVGQLSDTPGMNYAIPAGILSAFLQKAGKARGIPEWEKI